MQATMLPLFLSLIAQVQPAETTPFWQSFAAETYTQINSVQKIPWFLLKAAHAVTNEADLFGIGLIAERGAKFEATDCLTDITIPRRRLIFAGVSAKYSFIFYEHGGHGHHTHLLVFTGNEDMGYKIIKNVCPMASQKLKSVDQLKKIMATTGEWPAVDA